MRKKIWLLMVGIMIIGIAYAGFEYIQNEKIKNSFIEAEDKTIVLPVIIGGGDASWKNAINEVAVAYMKEHSNVRIDIRASTDIGDVNYTKSLVIEEAMGNLNGIVEMKNPSLYVEEGKLVELPSELTDHMKKVNTINGNIYSVSRYYSSRVVIYNKALFSELSLERPTSYQEFLAVCDKLKYAGHTPLAIGMKDLWHLATWANGLFLNDVLDREADWFRRCNEGSAHWTDSLPEKMLTDFQYLFQKKYVNADFAETTDADTIEKLTSGEVAMVYAGSWMFSQIQKLNPDFEMGCFFLPKDEGGSNAYLDDTWQWTITKSCQDEDLYDTAVDFLMFYYQDDIYQTVLQQMNGLSSLKDSISYQTIPVQKELIDLIGDSVEMQGDIWERREIPEGFSTVLEENMRNLALGNQTVDETSEILEMEWRDALEENQ